MLTQKDFDQINQELRQKGVFDRETREELTDHFSAEIESHITLGVEKQYAKQYVLRDIDKMDLKKINRNAILLKIKKPILMTFFSAFSACLFLFLNNPQLKNQPSVEHATTTSVAPKILAVSIEEPPYLWPILLGNKNVSAGYGEQKNPFTQKKQHHNGIDIKAKTGTNVLAPAAGIVLEIGENEKKGKYITLKHDDIYQTKYYHLSEIIVQKGQQLEAGESMGKVGSTGLSTGPHLHYEVVKNGKNVDPKDYLKRT